MTGNGSIDNPYIVDNWEDFKTAANKPYAYVKFAGVGTIDLKEIYPDGLTERIGIYANVDGNGWTIKNLYAKDKYAFVLYNKISNLNFVDFNVLCETGAARLMVLKTEVGFIDQCIFTGTVSGKVAGSSDFATLFENQEASVLRIAISRCRFNLKLSGGISMNQGNNIACSNCVFDVDSSENSTRYPFYGMYFRNCLIKGKYARLALSAGYSKYVILDVDCPSVEDVFGITKNEFIVGNADKSSYDTNKFYTLTTDQLKDKENLLSLGFPVGNGEISIINVSDFEHGGFYTYNGAENSNTTAVKSNWIPIENTALTVDCGNFRWALICRDADGEFRDMSTQRLDKYSGETAVLTGYSWIAETKIRLTYLNGSTVSLPQNCTLYNGCPWRIDDTQNDGLPFPALAPTSVEPPTSLPKPIPIRELQRDYITIYSHETPQDKFETHGLGVLRPTKCQMIEELNGKWELSIEHPIDDDGKWSYIKPFAIIKALGQLFTVRLVDEKWTGNKGMVSAKADHIFYQLNDTWIHHQKIYLYSRVADEIANNIASITDRQIREGHIYYNFAWDIPSELAVTGNFIEYWTNLSSGATFSEFVMGSNGLIIGTGGEIYRDNFYFSIRERIENFNDNAFDIRIGKNLRGIKRTIDTTRLCTYFSGVDDFGNELAIAFDTPTMLSLSFPHYVVRSQKFSYKIDSSLPPEEQSAKSGQLLANDVSLFFRQNCIPKISYEVDLEDVKKNADYFELEGTPDYRVGNVGCVHDDRLGGTIRLKISKIVKDAITGKTISVTFGDNLENSSAATSRSAIEDLQITPMAKKVERNMENENES